MKEYRTLNSITTSALFDTVNLYSANGCTKYRTENCLSVGTTGWEGNVPFTALQATEGCFYCPQGAGSPYSSCAASHLFRNRLCACAPITTTPRTITMAARTSIITTTKVAKATNTSIITTKLLRQLTLKVHQTAAIILK